MSINSQQMGYRLKYTVRNFGLFDSIGTESSTGYVSNLNAPTSTQMTSSEVRRRASFGRYGWFGRFSLQSLWKALSGMKQSWNKLQRRGNVQAA